MTVTSALFITTVDVIITMITYDIVLNLIKIIHY